MSDGQEIGTCAVAGEMARLFARMPQSGVGERRVAGVASQPVRRLPRFMRRGVRRTGGRTVYAIGDVHGRYDLLAALLGAIVADPREESGVSPVVVLLGDYVDRGPRSADVLTALDWLAAHAPVDLRLLRGNHEDAMLAYLDEPEAALGWLRVGGDATMRAYGVEPPSPDAAIVEHCRVRDALVERLPPRHLALLRHLELNTVVGDYLFVHAGLRPGIRLDRQKSEDMLWIRDGFVDRDHRFDRVVVHGHTWTSDEPVVRPYRIGVDTGAYRTGVLTTVRLDDAGHRFLQVRGDPGPGAGRAGPFV